jgi:preprotein translocase subunit SecA
LTDLVRTVCAAESVEEQWDLAALEKVLADEWQISVPLQARSRPSGITDEDRGLEKVLASGRRSI